MPKSELSWVLYYAGTYLFMILFVTQKRKLFSVNFESVFLTRKKYTNLKSIFYLKYGSLFVKDLFKYRYLPY